MVFAKTIKIAGLLSVVVGVAPFLAGTPSQAMPGNLIRTQTAAQNVGMIEKVRQHGPRHSRDWRRRHWRHYGHRYRDWNPGAYIALGVLGALMNHGMSERQARSAMERCDARFRSFEWDTGLYTTYGGEKKLCPYLR